MLYRRCEELRFRLRREFWVDLHKHPQQEVEKALVRDMEKNIGNSCNRLEQLRMKYAQHARDIVLVNEGRAGDHAKMSIALENYSSDRSHILTNISDVAARLSSHKEEQAGNGGRNRKPCAPNGKNK